MKWSLVWLGDIKREKSRADCKWPSRIIRHRNDVPRGSARRRNPYSGVISSYVPRLKMSSSLPRDGEA